jgi:hypothetical protein
LQLEYPGEPVQECEVGYNWDILAEKCLLLPVCDTGFVLVGNVCVDDCQINGNCIDSICEKGQILSNGECIDESGEECEVGYIEINGSCVLKPECKAGAEWYRPCGDCGTQTKVCSSAGTWGGWGSCEVL